MTCTDYRTSISQSQKFPGKEMAKGYGKAPNQHSDFRKVSRLLFHCSKFA